MNDYYETNESLVHSIEQKHVIPILVTLTEEEWLEAQSFYPNGVLYFQCVRNTMEDESELDHDSNFGDFIRWLFRLSPTFRDVPFGFVFSVPPKEKE